MDGRGNAEYFVPLFFCEKAEGDKYIKVSFFKSSRNIQKKDGGPDSSVSNN